MSGTTFKVGGSAGGDFHFIADQWNSNSTISFRTGSWIDNITINGTKYGGDGGTTQSANIPINIGGVVTLLEAKVSNESGMLSVLSFIINGQTVKVGNDKNSTSVFTSAGVGVRIVALHAHQYLDSIVFQYV